MSEWVRKWYERGKREKEREGKRREEKTKGKGKKEEREKEGHESLNVTLSLASDIITHYSILHQEGYKYRLSW